jgi:eukaryotic-like serine/threonine-protein kinase
MMPSEPTTTELDWTRLQGTILEGGYQLETILAAEESGATFKVRVLGDAAANAFAKLFVATASEAEEQTAAWESTRRCQDQHLAAPLGAGQTQVEVATLAYVVLKRPDETLDAAVRERALTKEEAGDVLLALIRGMDELHSHGLVHGCISPEQILALGESIKLSTECVRRAGVAPTLQLPRARYRAPESVGANVTASADIWCMGATLVEILTQQRCEENCIEQAASLPAPFDVIARRCLDPDPEGRINTGQVEALFRGRTARPVAGKPAPAGAAGVGVAAAASAAETPVRKYASLAPRRREVHEPQVHETQVHQPKLRAWWIYAAAGIVVVLGLIWLLRPKHTAVSPARQVAERSNGTSTKGSAWESKTIAPEDAKTVSPAQPAVTRPVPAAVPSDSVKGPFWRVVMYTYTREADADSKARWVNAKYPGLNAEAFTPSGGSPYLVVAGGRMSRDDAVHLRQRVRGLGLPRDSYIQNYQQ